MSRTTRTIQYDVFTWLKQYPEDYDPRDATQNGRDNKPRSLLYDDYIKQPGWNRDFYNGIKGRRVRKKSARRHRRREKIDMH